MGHYTDDALGFVLNNRDGGKYLEGKTFRDENFKEVSIGPSWPPGKIQLVDVAFENCKIEPGRFNVSAGVRLKNVIFKSIKSRGHLTVSSNAVLDNVVLNGKYPKKGIWICPDEVFNETKDVEYKKWVENEYKKIDCALDIQNYEADEILIYGIPVAKIKFNPDKHIVLKRLKELSLLKKIEIPGDGAYLKIAIQQLDTYGVDEAVVGLPLGNQERYLNCVEELKILRLNGIID